MLSRMRRFECSEFVCPIPDSTNASDAVFCLNAKVKAIPIKEHHFSEQLIHVCMEEVGLTLVLVPRTVTCSQAVCQIDY